jgi:valyl-tRNA synthetase
VKKDHLTPPGIATQSVVEKMLLKQKNQTRHELGREKFIDIVQDWKEEYHQKINNAFRKMGCSLDWSREAFTMVSAKMIVYTQDMNCADLHWVER